MVTHSRTGKSNWSTLVILRDREGANVRIRAAMAGVRSNRISLGLLGPGARLARHSGYFSKSAPGNRLDHRPSHCATDGRDRGRPA